MMAIEKPKRNTLKASRAQREGNALREYQKIITLNLIQKEVIVGTPFGMGASPFGLPRRRLHTLHKRKPQVECPICTNYDKS